MVAVDEGETWSLSWPWSLSAQMALFSALFFDSEDFVFLPDLICFSL